MTTSGSPISEEDRRALEALIIEGDDLSRLELLVGTFNIFEAIGAVQPELRHSAFLAQLLDPLGSHGFGDEFLRRYLRRAVQRARKELPLSALDLSVAVLDDAVVVREWRNIDILVRSERSRLAVIIENKISSSEHSDQLRRYHDIVRTQYPSWRIIAILLTPDGTEPSHEDFIPCDYGTIDRVLHEVLTIRESSVGEDVRIVAEHYSQLLQRHVVTDSEIARLCREIYRRHRRALDLIFEHRPDAGTRVYSAVIAVIESDRRVVLDHSTKAYIRFAPMEWDVPELRVGEGWTSTGRILLFEFQNDAKGLGLQLHIGPGPEAVRQALFRAALGAAPLLRPKSKSLNRKWNAIFPTRRILTAKQVAELSEEDVDAQIRGFWANLWARDMPAIVEAIRPGVEQIRAGVETEDEQHGGSSG